MCSEGNEAEEVALPSSWHQHASYGRTVFIRKDTYWESHLCPSRGSVCPLWSGRRGGGVVWEGFPEEVAFRATIWGKKR